MEKENNIIEFPKKKVKSRMSDQKKWWLILFLYFAVVVIVFVIEKIRLGLIG